MTLIVATRSGGRASAGHDNERDECSLLAFPGGLSCRGARVSMRGDPQGATKMPTRRGLEDVFGRQYEVQDILRLAA